MEFLVAEQVYLRPVVRAPGGDPSSEGAPGHGVQYLLDGHQVRTGQFTQIEAGQAATGSGQQAQQVLFDRAASQQAFKLILTEALQIAGMWRVAEQADDARVAQGVPVRYIIGDRRVGPPGDDDAHPGRWLPRQQTGDAMRPRPGGHAAVFVQPIHDQYQPTTLFLTHGRGLGEQIQKGCFTSSHVRTDRQVRAEQFTQLFRQHGGERSPGVLPGQPRGDKE